jgi:hypothetical protein
MTRPQPKRSALSVALILLALGLRILAAPIHLAQEEHLGLGPSAASVGGEPGVDGHGHGHGDDDEDGGEHTPHSAFDHLSELIVQRSPASQGPVAALALPVFEAWTLTDPTAASGSEEPELWPPRPGPRHAPRLRGPPVAS